MKKREDPIVSYMTVQTCQSCEWDHDGDKDLGGVEVRQNLYGKKYYVCPLTKEKIYGV